MTSHCIFIDLETSEMFNTDSTCTQPGKNVMLGVLKD